MDHTFKISEEQRQLILLALAELSIARPGWVDTLDATAKAVGDYANENGYASMFERFRRNHSDLTAEMLARETPINNFETPGYPVQNFGGTTG